MFWKIEGTDVNGNPSAVYIQGTFHLADDRIYPVAENVINAFESADRIAAELSAEDMENMQQLYTEKLIQSYNDAAGRNVAEELTDEELQFLLTLIPEETLSQLCIFEPWVLNNTLSSLLYIDTDLYTDKGLDFYFIARANEENRKIIALDTVKLQLDVLSYGNYEYQINSLKNMISELKDSDELMEITSAMYEAYVSDDITFFTELLNESEQSSADAISSDEEDSYMKVLLENRNRSWAEQIVSFINQGGTTFIFSGAAHFLGDNSVFAILEEMSLK